MTDSSKNEDLISESIRPYAGTFDTSSLARGEPGLPTGFVWRGQHFDIVELLDAWKESESENHAGGERYYRKRFFKVRVNTNEIMTLYCLRHTKPGQSAKKRWWLYTVERETHE